MTSVRARDPASVPCDEGAELTVELDGRIRSATPPAECLLGLSERELSRFRLQDLVTDEPARVLEILTRSLEAGLADDAVLTSLLFRSRDETAPFRCIVRVSNAEHAAADAIPTCRRVEIRTWFGRRPRRVDTEHRNGSNEAHRD